MQLFDEIRIALLIAATAALTAVSWRAIPQVRSHGFYRFIAWESIVALVIWNLPSWFDEPLSARQIASWMVLCASLLVLWQGVVRLRAARHTDARADRELYAFERTSELVTSGIYRYIRHPLYASLLYLAWGAFLKDVSPVAIILVVVASVSLFSTAIADEKECVAYFGEPYVHYMERTKRFIPYVL